MSYYEHTIIAKQDLTKSQFEKVKSKYENLINSSDGQVLKTEEWGLLSFARKLNKYNKGFYIHYKFKGNPNTLEILKKNGNIDKDILKYLIVKYKKLDLDTEYFKNNN